VWATGVRRGTSPARIRAPGGPADPERHGRCLPRAASHRCPCCLLCRQRGIALRKALRGGSAPMGMTIVVEPARTTETPGWWARTWSTPSPSPPSRWLRPPRADVAGGGFERFATPPAGAANRGLRAVTDLRGTDRPPQPWAYPDGCRSSRDPDGHNRGGAATVAGRAATIDRARTPWLQPSWPPPGGISPNLVRSCSELHSRARGAEKGQIRPSRITGGPTTRTARPGHWVRQYCSAP